MRLRKTLVALGVAASLGVGLAGVLAQGHPPGAADLVLDGGTSGPVKFPHLRHQQKLGDCMTCHTVFPQKAGAIEELKAQGKLRQKQVMNEQCTRCHKEKKQAGEASGPTTCTTCHVKS